ncbi:MAG: hypothetical protein JXL97_02090 [Bacteroidales bacterium]|nr:hypothetical protein [Bacteroidales bacterium]
MKILLNTLVLIFLSTFIFAQNDSIYFPYLLNGEVGTKSTLNINSGSGNKVGSQITEITEKYSDGDTTFMKLCSSTTGIGSVKLIYIVKSYNDTSFIELKTYLNVENYVKLGVLTLEPEWMIMPYEYVENQEVVGYTMTRDYGSYQIITKMKDRKVVGFETISTPAGDFECVKTSYVIEGKTNYGTFISNYVNWENKEVGLVKQEAYTESGRMETSYVLQSIDIK